MTRIIHAGWLLPFLALFLGCAGSPSPTGVFVQDAPEDGTYRIAPADVLDVRVWKNPELSVQAPVLPDGTVTVPLLGAVLASGLTTSEFEDLVEAELAEFISTAEVSVVVREVRGKRVSVVGEVSRPGPVILGADMYLVDALSQAGGFTAFADRKRVRLIREVDSVQHQFRFNYDAFVKGDAPDTNVKLWPGDVVVVSD